MNVANITTERSFPMAYTDYNASSDDILFALRESYKESCPFLLEQAFDDLAENYATEEPETFLDALGQELTCYGHALYELSTDSDSYALVVLSEERIEKFKEEVKAKDRKQKISQRKQARRKTEMPAKRINLGKRLPCDKMTLGPGYKVNLVTDCTDGILWLDYSMTLEDSVSSTRRFCSATLDIKEWPPRQSEDMELLVHRIVRRQDGIYIAIIQSNAVNEQGYLSDKSKSIVTGTDITRIREWKCLQKETEYDCSALTWFEDELFAADKDCAYHIKNVEDFANSCEKVLECKSGDVRWFPKFFLLGGRLYLFMHQSVYEWRKKSWFFKTGGEFEKVYTLNGFDVWNFVPVGETKIAFQVRPQYISRGETESRLTLLDLATGNETNYPCHYGYVRKWTDNRVCVLPVNVTSKIPIIECFDFAAEKKKSLMYGALGKDSVSDIYETECGTILKGSGKNIYRTTKLWEFMEDTKI